MARSIPFDLDKCMVDPDYPGLRISSEFTALGKYLEKLIEVIEYTQNQELIRLQAVVHKDLNEKHFIGLQEKIDETEYLAMHLIPRFFMGAFIIALTAAFETAANSIAQYVRKKCVTRLRLSDLNERSTFRKLILYLETVTKQSFSMPNDLADRMDELSTVRNGLAHANGDIASIKKAEADKLRVLVAANRGLRLSDGMLIVEARFAKENFEFVVDAVEGVLVKVEEHSKSI